MTDYPELNNLLLKKLPKPTQAKILSVAEYVHLDMRETIIEPNALIEFIDFPENSVMSVVKPMEGDSMIEVATVGREGALGFPVLFGVSRIEERIFCQVPGVSWRLPAKNFNDLCAEFSDFKSICMRYSMIYINQIACNMGCNLSHSLEARCARWLLMTHDRCGKDEFPLTQEFLAAMLGVSRTSINSIAVTLSKAELIKYVRGKITILSREGLEQVTCPCYFSEISYANEILSSVQN